MPIAMGSETAGRAKSRSAHCRRRGGQRVPRPGPYGARVACAGGLHPPRMDPQPAPVFTRLWNRPRPWL